MRATVGCSRVGACVLAVFAATLTLPAQEAPPASKIGNYQVQQSIDFGYRDSTVSGSAANYDTFINLGTGFRLLDQSLEAHASTPGGGLFDNLSLTSFGLGGDPQEVVRLHVDQGKWYDFNGQFRRDENVFNYNLLDNPLNPANNNLQVPITSALHELDLSHRMADYDLRLLPLSRVSLRLGYSRNVSTGPAYSSLHGVQGSVDTELLQDFRTTMNSFRAGLDWKPFARTVISFDQFLEYFKQDTTTTDQHQNFQLANGVPVDLGINFFGTTPCAKPILNAATTPPTANPSCSAYLSYSRLAPGRTSLPTERVSLHSNYFTNLDVTGSFSYNSGVNTVGSYAELANGLIANIERATQTLGGSSANRVETNGDGELLWALSPSLRLSGTATLHHFENPGDYEYGENVQFAQGPLAGGLGSMLVAPAVFSPANCPVPYTALTCPQHTASSTADVTNGIEYSYLGENIKTATVQLAYDFTPRWVGRIGYRYTGETVADGENSFVTSETYYPGNGAALAFRGDCALVKGTLPSACSLNPDGSVTYLNPAAATVVTPAEAANIHGNSLLVGMSVRPNQHTMLNADIEFYDANQGFARMDPRQFQRYMLHGVFAPSAWLSLNGNINIREDQDDVVNVNELDHNRSFDLLATAAPNQRISLDLGFTYDDIYSQALMCFSLGSSPVPAGVGLCPIAASPVGQGALGAYSDLDHFIYTNLVLRPTHGITAKVGYAGSFVRGDSLLLSPLAPPGPLQYNFQKPFASVEFRLAKNLAYNAAYGYYGYRELAGTDVPGLAPIPGEDFRSNLITTSVQVTF